MTPIQGELFKKNKHASYFDTHSLDFSKAKHKVVITHNSDFSTSDALKLFKNEEIFENSDIIWFSQNVDIQHHRIKSLPIGLENSQWFPEINKKNKILEAKPLNKKKNLCMAEFNPKTHPSRLEVFKYYNDQDWCVTNPTLNGLSFDLYLENLCDSIFCICPRGNGIDTHRLWEALYLDCIPIVERCINVEFYSDLPILIVDSLVGLTETMLYYAYDEMSKVKFSKDKLDMAYWNHLIKEASK